MLEELHLDILTKQMRSYLMKNVMPTLGKGLIECCRIQPAEPLDFLVLLGFKSVTFLNVCCYKGINTENEHGQDCREKIKSNGRYFPPLDFNFQLVRKKKEDIFVYSM